MSYLAAAVTVVGLLCLVDLLLTFGVIRRLREHSVALAGQSGGGVGEPLLDVGETVGDFAAVTVNGEPVLRAFVDRETIVGFLSPGCPPCERRLPQFVEAARTAGRDRVLAVLTDTTEADAAEMLTALSPVARVVVEAEDGALTKAFGVTAFPAFCRIDAAHTVTVVGFDAVFADALAGV
jgi:thiol-disulfide isomerase/thioredoxin